MKPKTKSEFSVRLHLEGEDLTKKKETKSESLDLP